MLLGSLVENYDDGDENEPLESPQGTQESGSMYMPSSTHASPPHDAPYSLPTRTTTEMSHQTSWTRNPRQSQAQSYPDPESSRRDQYRPFSG
jgi:hypothetical protein